MFTATQTKQFTRGLLETLGLGSIRIAHTSGTPCILGRTMHIDLVTAYRTASSWQTALGTVCHEISHLSSGTSHHGNNHVYALADKLQADQGQLKLVANVLADILDEHLLARRCPYTTTLIKQTLNLLEHKQLPHPYSEFVELYYRLHPGPGSPTPTDSFSLPKAEQIIKQALAAENVWHRRRNWAPFLKALEQLWHLYKDDMPPDAAADPITKLRETALEKHKQDTGQPGNNLHDPPSLAGNLDRNLYRKTLVRCRRAFPLFARTNEAMKPRRSTESGTRLAPPWSRLYTDGCVYKTIAPAETSRLSLGLLIDGSGSINASIFYTQLSVAKGILHAAAELECPTHCQIFSSHNRTYPWQALELCPYPGGGTQASAALHTNLQWMQQQTTKHKLTIIVTDGGVGDHTESGQIMATGKQEGIVYAIVGIDMTKEQLDREWTRGVDKVCIDSSCAHTLGTILVNKMRSRL